MMSNRSWRGRTEGKCYKRIGPNERRKQEWQKNWT